MTKFIKPKLKKHKLSAQGALAAMAGTLLLAGEASADYVPEDYQNLAQVDGVQSAMVQADGSLLIILENGQSITVPAGSFAEENGQIFVNAETLEQFAEGGSELLMAGLGALAVAGGITALGGGDDEVEAPPAPEGRPHPRAARHTACLSWSRRRSP